MSDAADEAADWAFENVGLVLSRAQADRLAVFLASREAAAERRGIERAAEVVREATRAPGQRNVKDQWREAIGIECAAAIRALLTESER